MKSVLLSIKPKYCELIANGKKTVEVRKTRAKLETPFKCYIYCTLSGSNEFFKEDCKGDIAEWNRSEMALKKGKVIGKFVCDAIYTFEYENGGFLVNGDVSTTQNCQAMSCLSDYEFRRYVGEKTANGWHISDLVIYDKPIELSEFALSRPPQSWCYVEETKQ